MKCVIVAAGMSTRLRPLTDRKPKCLLTVGGKTILARTVESLLAEGVTSIAVVVGFEAEKVRLHLQRAFPGRRFRFILNPHFASTNNAYSLLLSWEFFLGRGPRNSTAERLLILDSDIIFHPKLLSALDSGRNDDRIAVQKRDSYDAEEIKVSVDQRLFLSQIGKDIGSNQIYGESIGIELFSHNTGKMLYQTLERRVRLGGGRKEFYEAAFQEMIDSGAKISVVDVSKYPAIEIDSPDDLKHAEAFTVPQIDMNRDVRVP
jgi:choline kinase